MRRLKLRHLARPCRVLACHCSAVAVTGADVPTNNSSLEGVELASGYFNLEVSTVDVEDGAVVDFRHLIFVTQLLLPVDTVHAFSNKQYIRQP